MLASHARERTAMRKQIFCLVVVLLFFGANTPAQQAPSATQIRVIRAGKLIDVDAGRVQTNQMILVRGGKIEAMGENLPIPSGAAMRSEERRVGKECRSR